MASQTVSLQASIGMIDDAGWFDGVERLDSPNCDARPAGSSVSLLVIHNISLPPGEFGTRFVHELFTNTLDCGRHPYFASLVDVKVSSHLLVDRTGLVTQFVPLEGRAWHAGQSWFDGQTACNNFSVGIELEGTDTEPYTDAQYRVLVMLTQAIMRRYPAITLARIVGHSDIAPARKTDPGVAFDWERYRAALAGY